MIKLTVDPIRARSINCPTGVPFRYLATWVSPCLGKAPDDNIGENSLLASNLYLYILSFLKSKLLSLARRPINSHQLRVYLDTDILDVHFQTPKVNSKA